MVKSEQKPEKELIAIEMTAPKIRVRDIAYVAVFTAMIDRKSVV